MRGATRDWWRNQVSGAEELANLLEGRTSVAVVGEMVFELEGEPERVVSAGEVFWEPGGDVIHYQEGNNRDDSRVRFTVTMLCQPGAPMLRLVSEEELTQRRDRRAPRP
jgi:hypothetical protein